MTPRLWERPALRVGVPLGVVLGLVSALLTLLMITGHDIVLGGWFGLTQFIVVASVFVGAGWWVSQHTGNVTQGSLTGLTIGVVFELVGGLNDFVLSVVAPGPYAHLVAGLDRLSGQPVALAGVIFAALLLNLMQYGIFGAAFGALGGLGGTMHARQRRQADSARLR